MMNIVSASGADAAASTKSSSAGKKGAEGFSDALSEFDQDQTTRTGDNSAKSSDDTLPPQQDAAEENGPSKPKPIIDIRPESIRRPVMLQQDTAQRTAIPKDMMGVGSSRDLTMAEKKLKDALAMAKALTEKSDALDPDDVPADQMSQEDVDALLAAGTNVELGEILTLLNGQGAAAALEGMAPQQTGPSQNGKRSQADADVVGKGKAAAASAMDTLSKSGSSSDQVALSAEGEVSAEPDRLFRFQGGKGERLSMDMVVGGGRGEQTAEFRASGGGSAETVTVLDSRRFLGLAPNASALTSALSGDKEWAAAMQPSAATQNILAQNSTGQVVNTLKLQMNPHDLGSVTAMLRLQGEQLSVHLTVENRAAYRQLADDSSGILDALRAQGFAVEQVTISISPSSGSDAASNQQNGQQASMQGERQGGAAGRGQEDAPGRQFSGQAAGNGNEGTSEDKPASSAGSARSGQLYL
jgi:chemotaxis protein MotD